jgi:hypothetical protein
VVRVEPGQPFERYCPECGRWGAFSYGSDSIRGISGIWYCFEHKALGEKTSRLA